MFENIFRKSEKSDEPEVTEISQRNRIPGLVVQAYGVGVLDAKENGASEAKKALTDMGLDLNVIEAGPKPGLGDILAILQKQWDANQEKNNEE